MIVYYFYTDHEENDSEAIDDSVSLEERVERAKVLLAQKRAAQAQEKAHVSDVVSLVHVSFIVHFTFMEFHP